MKSKGRMTLISSIALFAIGLLLFINPETVVKFISYCFGGLLIIIGAYKSVNYYIQDKRLGVVNRNEMAFGITAIILGVVFIFLADAIELLLRFIVGGWVIITGLSKIVSTFYTTNRDNKFYALLIMGFIFIALGLYIILVSNLALSIIGLFMMIYGIIDFISYFVYKDSNIFNKIEKDNRKDVTEVTIIEEKTDEEESAENSQTKKKRKK